MAFAALLALKHHVLQTALTSLVIFILYVLFFLPPDDRQRVARGCDGRINMAEGGGSRTSPLIQHRAGDTGRRQAPLRLPLPRAACEDGQIPAFRPPGILRGAVPACKGTGRSLGRAGLCPRSPGPVARSRTELRVGTGKPSWKSQTSREGQSIDREQGYSGTEVY